MMTVIIVVHLMIVLAMIGVVLLQKSEGGGLGIGSAGGFLSSRGTANVLTRTTAFLAMAFFATSLLLSWIAGLDRKPTSILNTGAPAGQSGAPPSDTQRPPGGGLLDQLRGPEQPQPPTPPAGGPQVPQSQ
jgi:preprotein translocase subunit SecG